MNLKISVILFSFFLLNGSLLAQEQNYAQSLAHITKIYQELKSQLPFTSEDQESLLKMAKFLKNPQGLVASTEEGRAIPYYIFENELTHDQNTLTVMWVGGVHPDEFAPLFTSWKLLMTLIKGEETPPTGLRLIYIPLLNIDGMITGHKKQGYPTRENAKGIDVNRSFYDRKFLPNFKGPKEVEMLLDMIEKFNPKFWVAPHASLDLLDLDGIKTPETEDWVQFVHQESLALGGPGIEVHDFITYGPPNEKKNWSLGRLAAERNSVAALTFEFPGPGTHPDPNDPNAARITQRRKQLGRFENNTHLAVTYYEQNYRAFLASIFAPIDYPF